jgi:hypothetical protein
MEVKAAIRFEQAVVIKIRPRQHQSMSSLANE